MNNFDKRNSFEHGVHTIMDHNLAILSWAEGDPSDVTDFAERDRKMNAAADLVLALELKADPEVFRDMRDEASDRLIELAAAVDAIGGSNV